VTEHDGLPSRPGDARGADAGELTPDELQLAFHEVECRTYDERFGITYDEHAARGAARETHRLLGRAPLGRVLDVGCGTGYLGLGLAAAGRSTELHLVDLSPGMLGRARDHAAGLGIDARVVRATATALPYPDHSVDAIVTRGVLHHLHDVPSALREWRRVVRPGGPVLVLSEPTRWADRIGGVTARATLAALGAARTVARGLGRPLSELDPDARREHDFWDLVAMAANLHTFAPRDLEALARDSGFTDVRVRGSGLASIVWATVYYVLAGELPGLAASQRARRRSGRVFAALRRLDGAVVERLVPDRALMTVQAVLRA
jgi:ubiquinone/menaquinone biosynthesis C-methylase UbiE